MTSINNITSIKNGPLNDASTVLSTSDSSSANFSFVRSGQPNISQFSNQTNSSITWVGGLIVAVIGVIIILITCSHFLIRRKVKNHSEPRSYALKAEVGNEALPKTNIEDAASQASPLCEESEQLTETHTLAIPLENSNSSNSSTNSFAKSGAGIPNTTITTEAVIHAERTQNIRNPTNSNISGITNSNATNDRGELFQVFLSY